MEPLYSVVGLIAVGLVAIGIFCGGVAMVINRRDFSFYYSLKNDITEAHIDLSQNYKERELMSVEVTQYILRKLRDREPLYIKDLRANDDNARRC